MKKDIAISFFLGVIFGSIAVYALATTQQNSSANVLGGSKILFTIQKDYKTHIYIANTPKEAELIASQEVAEGSGGIDMNSIRWSEDGQFVIYDELAIVCETACESPADFTTKQTTYKVEPTTKVKTVITE